MELHRPNFTQPPPDLVDGEEEYEVEKVLDAKHKGRGRKLHYLCGDSLLSESEGHEDLV